MFGLVSVSKSNFIDAQFQLNGKSTSALFMKDETCCMYFNILSLLFVIFDIVSMERL